VRINPETLTEFVSLKLDCFGLNIFNAYIGQLGGENRFSSVVVVVVDVGRLRVFEAVTDMKM
jgi:hypothetical protein